MYLYQKAVTGNPEFLASDKLVSFTATASQEIFNNGAAVPDFEALTQFNKLVVPAGTVFPANDATAKGILLHAVDITNGPQPCAVMVEGYVYKGRLPIAPSVEADVAMEKITFVDENRMPYIKADTGAPLYLVGPIATSRVEGSLDVYAEISEYGAIYYMVVPNGSAAPTIAQVVAQADYGDVTVAKKGFVIGTILDATNTGLTANTDYDVYIVAGDDESPRNMQSAVVKIDVHVIDTTAPAMHAQTPVVPAPDAIDQAVNVNVVWTFTKALDDTCVTAENFKLIGNGVIVPGALGIDATKKIVTFNPTDNLANSVVYAAIVETGVVDLSGNHLAAQYVTKFTTVAGG